MKSLFLIASLWLGTSLAYCQSSFEPPKDRENFHLFLLIGQSNMAGRGKVSPQDTEPHPRVWMLDRQQQWVPAVDPMHFDKPIAGVGLGKTFGKIVAESDPGITVGLIPCGVGGSPIAAWEPGAFYRPTRSHPYDDAMARCKHALRSGVLRGILWHQGESDAKAQLCEVYEEKLHALVARLRRELDSPQVPFLAGQLGRFAERPWDEYRKRIDQVHRRLPEALAQARFVSSKGLTHKGDRVHFDSRSYRILGERYAEAYLDLLSVQETR